MNQQRILWVATAVLVLGMTLALAGCGGGGGGSPPAPPAPAGLEITGDALQPVPDNPMLTGKLATNVPTAVLEPVPNATVELWEVDDSGALVGSAPINSVMASLTGSWKMTLPPGTDLNAKLVVLVRLAAGDMRGQVVSEHVTISPLSEFVLETLTSDGNDLGNVSPADVITLNGYVAAADVSKALGKGSLDEALQALDSQFADDTGYDSIVDTSQQPAGDATDVAGDYWYLDLGLQVSSFQYQLCAAEEGEFRVVGGADGTGTAQALGLTSFQLVQVATQPPPLAEAIALDYQLLWEVDVETPDAFTVDFTRNADGSLAVIEPFEEDICDPMSPCVGTGWRYPANAATFCPISPAPDNGVFAALVTERGVQYGLTPEGVIDTTNPLGTSYTYYLELLAKKGPVSNLDLDGRDFGWISFGRLMEAGAGRRLLSAGLGLVSFDPPAGEVTLELAELSLERLPDGTAALLAWDAVDGDENSPVPTIDGQEVAPYSLDEATGEVTISAGAPEQSKAFLANGGDFLMWRESEGMNEAYGENLINVAVRLPDEAPPDITNRDYKVLWMDLCYGEEGGTEMARTVGASLRFMPPQNNLAAISLPGLSLAGTGVYRQKANDLDTEPVGGNDELTLLGDWAWSGEAPGLMQFTVSEDGDDLYAQGFMNHDGTFGIFGLYSSQMNGSYGDACLGIALLIQQPSNE